MPLAIGRLDVAEYLERMGGRPVMLTMTYPGDWESVAPSAEVCRRHVDALRARWRRHYGVRLDGLWKREFQRRGAPHYHVWTVLPAGVSVNDVRGWLGPTWAGIVGLADVDLREQHARVGCSVDPAQGERSSDPQRLGVYFSKHGSFSAKDYQNNAPDQWVEQGSVGRFWGVWGLKRAVVAVEVHGHDAIAAARILRRLSRSRQVATRVPSVKVKTRERYDTQTGEWLYSEHREVRSTRLKRLVRMRGHAGYVLANDAPAVASQLARGVDAWQRPARSPNPRYGLGPAGFLP
jgi:hypothetical protein